MFSLKSLELDFSGFAQGIWNTLFFCFLNTAYIINSIVGCNGEQLDRILDFVFLEPEDDPRHFCYLTVVAQKSCEAYTAPYALLYSLSYVIKEVFSEGRILYEDLQYITLRLDLNFGPLIVSWEHFCCQSLEFIIIFFLTVAAARGIWWRQHRVVDLQKSRLVK